MIIGISTNSVKDMVLRNDDVSSSIGYRYLLNTETMHITGCYKDRDIQCISDVEVHKLLLDNNKLLMTKKYGSDLRLETRNGCFEIVCPMSSSEVLYSHNSKVGVLISNTRQKDGTTVYIIGVSATEVKNCYSIFLEISNATIAEYVAIILDKITLEPKWYSNISMCDVKAVYRGNNGIRKKSISPLYRGTDIYYKIFIQPGSVNIPILDPRDMSVTEVTYDVFDELNHSSNKYILDIKSAQEVVFGSGLKMIHQTIAEEQKRERYVRSVSYDIQNRFKFIRGTVSSSIDINGADIYIDGVIFCRAVVELSLISITQYNDEYYIVSFGSYNEVIQLYLCIDTCEVDYILITGEIQYIDKNTSPKLIGAYNKGRLIL